MIRLYECITIITRRRRTILCWELLDFPTCPSLISETESAHLYNQLWNNYEYVVGVGFYVTVIIDNTHYIVRDESQYQNQSGLKTKGNFVNFPQKWHILLSESHDAVQDTSAAHQQSREQAGQREAHEHGKHADTGRGGCDIILDKGSLDKSTHLLGSEVLTGSRDRPVAEGVAYPPSQPPWRTVRRTRNSTATLSAWPAGQSRFVGLRPPNSPGRP